jgi:putative alpha-1,2-mannosidase
VMDNQYGPGTNGVPGNDDGGALSSWWVLAAMGLHPVPGSPEWTLGTPRFARVTVRDAAGDASLVVVKGARNVPVDKTRIVHEALLGGAALSLP